MDLLLWRWSTAVQVTSIALIVVFFIALRRTDRRAELDWWVAAWSANLVALSVTLLFWYLEPGPAAIPIAGALYVGGKTAFVLLLVQGAWSLVRPGANVLPAWSIAALAAYMLVGGVTLTSVPLVGAVQHSVMGVLLLGAGIALAIAGRAPVAFLVGGMLIRGLFAIAEAAAYFAQVRSPDSVDPRIVTFLAAHSSIDTAAEWLIALGCVLAVTDRAQRELRQYNEQLLEAYEGLRQLADRDPLTTLANRRGLPEVFRAVQPGGATVLFFDLDGFKRINDRYGHLTGDDCLRRFAAALRDSFRPEDAVLRYGGDEFVVVAGGMDRASALQRVETLRARLRDAPWHGPRITFSVGLGTLAAGGHPDAALDAADAAMYLAKRPPPGTPAVD